MNELLQNLNPGIIAIFGFSLVGILAGIVYSAKKKRDARNYADAHPNVARVLPEGKVLSGGTLTFHSVDGARPHTFLNGMKQGIFLLPGTHVLEVTYGWTEVGIVHKTITHTFGPTRLEVTAETAKRYQLAFDTEAKRYQFTELTDR